MNKDIKELLLKWIELLDTDGINSKKVVKQEMIKYLKILEDRKNEN